MSEAIAQRTLDDAARVAGSVAAYAAEEREREQERLQGVIEAVRERLADEQVVGPDVAAVLGQADMENAVEEAAIPDSLRRAGDFA
jgi:hypothetical protein